MKTIFSPSKKISMIVLLQVVFFISLTMEALHAQSIQAVNLSIPPVDVQTTHSSVAFQATAFPTQDTRSVKVIFQDPTGNGASIFIRDSYGHIVHSKNLFHSRRFMGKFDLSQLPDGEYTLAIVSLSKAGFNKHTYLYTFQIHSTTKRSLIPRNKEIEKSLYTPRFLQVRK